MESDEEKWKKERMKGRKKQKQKTKTKWWGNRLIGPSKICATSCS